MSEAIKQPQPPRKTTPIRPRLMNWMYPIRISGRTRNIGRYLSVFAMKTLCIIARKLGKTHIAWTTTEVLEPIGL